MDIEKKKNFILNNLKALVESGRNMTTFIQVGEIKPFSNETFSITEFPDEVVMRFKKKKGGDHGV
jgi:hypothetical protein